MDTTAPTKSEYSQEKIASLVEKVIGLMMEHEGKWIIIDKSHGVNREPILQRVKEIMQLMGIRYAVPTPEYLGAEAKEYYKIKVVTDAQYENWKRERWLDQLRGTEPEWKGEL